MKFKRTTFTVLAVLAFLFTFSIVDAQIEEQDQVEFDKPEDKNAGAYCVVVDSIGGVNKNGFDLYDGAKDFAKVSSLDPGVKDIAFLAKSCVDVEDPFSDSEMQEEQEASVENKSDTDPETSEKEQMEAIDKEVETMKENNDDCKLESGRAYSHSNTQSVWLITEQGTKRPFQSSRVFKTHFDSFSEVQETTETKINNCSDDKAGFVPFGPKYDPQGGGFVKIPSDNRVYMLLSGKKYWVNSEKVFEGLNYSWDWIEDVDPKLLDKYETAGEISNTDHHPAGSLVKYPDSPKVYKIEKSSNGELVKRHIADESVFNQLNYRFDRVVTIDSNETYTEGDPITSQGGV